MTGHEGDWIYAVHYFLFSSLAPQGLGKEFLRFIIFPFSLWNRPLLSIATRLPPAAAEGFVGWSVEVAAPLEEGKGRERPQKCASLHIVRVLGIFYNLK